MKENGTNNSGIEGALAITLCVSAFILSVWPNALLAYSLGAILIALIIFNFPTVLTGIRYSIVFWSGIILVTAGIGLWSAYQTTNASPKLLNLVLAFLLAVYFSKINSLSSWTTWIFASGALFFAIAFALVKLNIIEPHAMQSPNRLIDLSTIFVPFLALAFLKNTNILIRSGVLAAGFLVIAGLIFAGSRGAIGAVLLGLFIWYLLTNKNLSSKQGLFLGQFVFYATIIFGFACFFFIDEIHNSPLVNIPGARSRIELYANSMHLVKDFWVVGGGLNSFGGLYSQYIVSVPFLLFTYGHNLYLDLLLEQGIFGLLATLAVLFSSLFIGFKQLNSDSEDRHLTGASIASVVVLLLHGFIDNPIYGDFGSPLLFIGAAVLFGTSKSNLKTNLLPIHVATATLFLAAMIIGNPLASIKSNLTSIQMAKIQLSQWPTNEWSTGENDVQLAEVGAVYQTLIADSPRHAPNYYRLGLIAAESKKFKQAKENFENALTLSPKHPGIKKNLGLAALWTGDQTQAINLLNDVPGIEGEIDAYIWWWTEQMEPELSNKASELKNNPDWINR